MEESDAALFEIIDGSSGSQEQLKNEIFGILTLYF